MKLSWLGDASPKGLDAKLKAAGWTSAPERPDAVVVHSVRPRKVPANVGGAARWLWVTSTAVEPALAQAAVLAGAYDVVALDAPGAAAKLIARLGELAVPETVPALPATAVAV